MPAVLLDFGQQTVLEGDQPRNPFYGLLMLRRKMAEATSPHILKFPYYDFACLWYFYQKGKSVAEIRRMFPSEEAEFVGVVIDAFAQGFWANLLRAGLNVLNRQLGREWTLHWQQRGLNEEWLKSLKNMAPDSELIDALPNWFASDLNNAIANDSALQKLVLFFDTHEAFWGDERDRPTEKFFYQDEWLRRLFCQLNRSRIVVVVAGREKPRWDKASKHKILLTQLDAQLVWHLSEEDAKSYLGKIGISEPQLQQAMISYTSTDYNQVHPLYLSLYADIVLAAKQRGESLTATDFSKTDQMADKAKDLIHRFLRYVNQEIQSAIYALSACRVFDQKIYFTLGGELHFQATGASFKTLTAFSFVWEVDSPKTGWYCIHKLLRRLLSEEQDNSITPKAHAILEKYYTDQGNQAEAMYHSICHSRWQGQEECQSAERWLTAFSNAQQQENLELCRTLLEISTELGIRTALRSSLDNLPSPSETTLSA